MKEIEEKSKNREKKVREREKERESIGRSVHSESKLAINCESDDKPEPFHRN